VRTQGRVVPQFSAAAEQRLLAHAWPGNVRELDNVIQRALILQAGAVIDGPDLQIEGALGAVPMPAVAPCASALSDDLRSREQQLILDTLRSVGGSRRSAAGKLGISERTLRYKLARLREAGVELPD
jgi:two-component system response regulator FlrC